MKISKWHGLGNDFILTELSKSSSFDIRGAVERLCDRHFGVGADGVVTIRHLSGNAFEMRIYNADGTEPEMCGNATRCVGLYIKRRMLARGDEFELRTKGGIVRPKVLENGTVRVDMGEPRLLRGEIPVAGNPAEQAREVKLRADGRDFTAFCVSMGNPHAVIFVPDIEAVELEKWGPVLECDPQFPKKINVEFVEVRSPGMVRMRVWERGCGITMACGTGSCATAVAGHLSGRTGSCVTVLLDGGELLVEHSAADNHVYMTGPAVEVFRGELVEKI
ncbi:diaminopimelate epimerase [Victivallaceae bacterium BBE-744-WT-12]|uniref:Diaminopimelate epimerase n=1 Tax=Victivallis lenta TaxID=2606640 RepID=A0A844G4L4_9BACT|nr:diaminopimelate epimerase [Victivallis lenta]MBS1455384.1 diaminopimelate epimerase [Lentisphaeria bacterium]MST97852.1 diaminopimelate epimerase [Victivallis lenta]HBP07350.1 diaminopimelate epimerase [Lentisphaeria bacterium]